METVSLLLHKIQGYVGKSATPKHTGSLNLFGNWKGFDF